MIGIISLVIDYRYSEKLINCIMPIIIAATLKYLCNLYIRREIEVPG